MKNGREGGARGIYASANMKSIAYYGNFLKLRVAERREQCEQKTANYWIVNRGPRYECPRKVDAEDEAIHPPDNPAARRIHLGSIDVVADVVLRREDRARARQTAVVSRSHAASQRHKEISRDGR